MSSGKLNIIAFIQARMGSKRFPGKVLAKVDGVTLLELQLKRVSRTKLLDKIVVIITGSPGDDDIYSLCQKQKITCFRGSERDVLDRYYRAAVEFNADIIVRLTADCPLTDPGIVDEMVRFFIEYPGGLDYLGNTEPSPGTYPDGMDVSVFTFDALKRNWKEAEKPSEREHVIFYFHQHPEIFKIYRKDLDKNLSSYRFTVDHEEDLELVRQLVAELKRRKQFGSLKEILKIMYERPELKSINSKYRMGEGWQSSFKKDEEVTSMQAVKAKPLVLKKGNEFWDKVIRVIPGGAQTFSKMPYQHVEGVAPKFLIRGKGCRVWDLDGNEFIDSVLGLGAIILGHTNSEVDKAAATTANEYFITPSLPHPLEYELALKMIELVPCAEMVRYGKNGTDVTSAAVRLSRHITKRDIIACTGYHGWQDWYIGATQRHSGVPEAVRKLTKVFQYNVLKSLEDIFRENPDNVAAVILEPVNFEPPQDGFLHKVRELCNKNKTLLIFDEIVTGLRIDIGGAQKYFGVTPDLGCFGKSIANGYPLSVLCGRAKYMEEFKEAFFSSTFGGEIVSIAAALKTLEIHQRENLSAKMNHLGEMLIKGWTSLVKELGITFSDIVGYGWWPKYRFHEHNGYTPLEILTLFQQELVKRGILTRNTVFLSLSHGEPEIREMLTAIKQALLIVKEAVENKKLKEFLEGRVIEPVIRDENIKH